MFSVLRDLINPSQKLNNDLDKGSIWANKLKMSFNPDPSKQAQEVNFSRKIRSNILPLSALLTIYCSFIRLHLDYGDVIYDQPEDELFSSKIESVQYNAPLVITEAIRGTPEEKLHQELDL